MVSLVTTGPTLSKIPLEAAAALSEGGQSEMPLYLPDGEGAVLYRQAGCNLRAPDLGRLRAAGHTHLFVDTENLSRCEKALEEKLNEIIHDTRLAPEQRATCVQTIGASVARDLIATEDVAAQTPRAAALVDNVVESVLADPAVAANLLRVSAHHKSTASHMFSVSFFGVLLGYATFGPERQVLQEIGLAGMLHDLGKTSVPSAILNKDSSLTPDELHVIHHHPIESIRLLGEDQAVNARVRQMILQHHEKLDGTGYPLGLSDSELLEGSKILSIVDSFHAMIGRRTYQNARKPAEAMKLMGYHVGTQFDPQLFANWTKVLSRYWNSASEIVDHVGDLEVAAPAFHHDHKPVKDEVRGRKAARLACNSRINVRCIYAGRLIRATEAMDQQEYALIDLSRGGLCMVGDHPMFRGEIVNLQVTSEGRSVWVQGMVRWCRRDPHAKTFRIGVNFLHRISENQIRDRTDVAGIDDPRLFPHLDLFITE